MHTPASSPPPRASMLNDPKVEFSPVPKGIMAFAEFMHGTGAIKVKPASWKDAFLPELHGLPGN